MRARRRRAARGRRRCKGFTDERARRDQPDRRRAAGDTLIFVADKAKVANTVLGAIRLHIGEKLGLIRKGEWQFMWLTDPPLFEVDERRQAAPPRTTRSRRRASRTSDLLETRPGQVLRARLRPRAQRRRGRRRLDPYPPQRLQARVFKALGISEEDARAKFGFLLDAFKYGPPPHGGIAFGLDRLAMLMTRRRVAARRDRVPEDAEGHRPDDRRARRRCAKKQLDELLIALKE